ncbi:MAG: hypothetical protein QG635_1366 [Bacteroidota bacterium]|nr:hypothetical protein [Bacteroidota bacterium]
MKNTAISFVKRNEFYSIVLFVFFLLSIPLQAEDNILVNPWNKTQWGAFVHAAYVNHDASFIELPKAPSCCMGYNGGSGYGFDFGILNEQPVSKHLFIATRIGFYWNEVNQRSDDYLKLGYNGEEIDGVFQHQLTTTHSSMFGQLMLGARLYDRLLFYLGGNLDYFLYNNFDQREVLIKPEIYGTFENGKRVRNIYTTQNIRNALDYNFSIIGGAGFEFPMNKKRTVRLAPEAFIAYTLLPLIDTYDWYALSVHIGVAIKFSTAREFPLSVGINQVEPMLVETFKSCDGYKVRFDKTEYQFEPKVDAAAGLTSWGFHLNYAGKTLKSENGYGMPPDVINYIIMPDSAEIAFNAPATASYTFYVLDKDEKEDSVVKSFDISRKDYGFGFTSEAKAGEGDKAEVKIIRTISTNMRPLLNYIFFDRQSARLPDRFIKLKKNEADAFSIDELHNEATLLSYYHILNIIGSRLRKNSNAIVTLVGCNAGAGVEQGYVELARQRAATVRDYLIKTWKIEPERLKMKANPHLFGAPVNPSLPGKEKDYEESYEENRRVEIIPDPEFMDIIKPIITKDTSYEISQPELKFKGISSGTIALGKWRLNVWQGDSLLKSETGSGVLPAELTLDLKPYQEQIVKLKNNIKYRFEVEDVEGGKCFSTGEIPVNITMKDSTFDKYSLILFEFNSYAIKDRNKEIVDIIRNALNNGADVTVTGYTDIVGDTLTNLRLSKNRAISTASDLFGADLRQSADYSVEDFSVYDVIKKRLFKVNSDELGSITGTFVVRGLGERKPLLYENALPEGRFYCRTVTVDVINPLK